MVSLVPATALIRPPLVTARESNVAILVSEPKVDPAAVYNLPLILAFVISVLFTRIKYMFPEVDIFTIAKLKSTSAAKWISDHRVVSAPQAVVSLGLVDSTATTTKWLEAPVVVYL
jgi:hypothetical protein